MNPLARHIGLLVEELPGELLIYDLAQNKAHCLNRTAAFVWQQCNGHTTVQQMAAGLQQELNLPGDEGLVWLTLDRLEQAGLLQERPARPVDAPVLLRRDFLSRLGLVGALAVVLPAVTSITAPTPAMAASPVERFCEDETTLAACVECCGNNHDICFDRCGRELTEECAGACGDGAEVCRNQCEDRLGAK